MASLKELAAREAKLAPGHRACAGCIPALTFHQVLRSAPGHVVASCATGCIEVITTIFPYTAWNIPFIHNAFENSAATISGVEAAYLALKRKGKVTKDIKFIGFGGDEELMILGYNRCLVRWNVDIICCTCVMITKRT